MYPRLFLARNLLKDDGVIFVSIDDNEVHNLKMIMNEVFGEDNFVDSIVWKKRYGGGAKEKYLVTIHEYILCYVKNKEALNPIFISPKADDEEKYYKGKDEKFNLRGPYRTHPLEAGKAMGDRPNLIFPIKVPDGTEIMPKRQWLWSSDRVERALENNDLEFMNDKNGNWSIHTKQYLRDEEGNLRQAKAFSIIDNVFTQHGTNEGIEIFGDARVFPYPKPTEFIAKLMDIGLENKDEIVLDFFAGSCPLAHAVMRLNVKDGGNRKFICVQLAEPCDENSEAYKAGFKTIADIGKERIRRAAKKIKKEQEGKLDFNGGKLDLGFKVFKLDESNFKQWRADIKTAEELEKRLSLFVDNVKSESTQENILYELIVKTGLDLNVKVEAKKVNRKQYFVIEKGKLIICLEEKITKGLVDKIISQKPEKFICLDRAFENNDQLKTNSALQMEAEKIEFKVI
jgi:adenine-specific DNA-methyltransferase